jgi:hypothetical protein
MPDGDKTGDYRNTHVEKKADYTAVAIAFIKYAAYVLIFFGFLYFVVKYVLPFFK